jgi:hypothetical protein
MKRKKKRKKSNQPESISAANGKRIKKRFPEVWKQVHPLLETIAEAQGTDGKANAHSEHLAKAAHLFYGKEDPSVAAKKIVEDWEYKPFDTLFLIGVGLGCIPLEALRKGVGNCRLILIEPSAQVFVNALEYNDLKPLLTNDRIDIYVGANLSVAEIVSKYKEIIPLGKTPVYTHPNYESIFGENVRLIVKELSERIREVRDAWFTIREHGRMMFKNTMANLPSLFAGAPMRRLKGAFKGIPAICVAAGPSLDDALPELKKIDNRALIIACDSAVKALLSAGIKPHIVVTVDIFETNIDKLKPYVGELDETLLIFGLESNPDNVRLFLGPRRVGISAFSKLMSFWLDPQLNLQSLFPEMSSVSHVALFSALALGAAPIAMVGMDLSYVDGKSHSYGSAFLHSIDNTKTATAYGNAGDVLPTSSHFVADRLLIENIAQKENNRFINTSTKGAYVNGAQVKRLAELIDNELTAKMDVRTVLDSVDWTCAATESKAASELNTYVRLLEQVQNRCARNRQSLSETIHSGTIQNDKRAGLAICNRLEKDFEAFENQHLPYKSMNKEVMLSGVEAIGKKREALLAQRASDPSGGIKDRLDLLLQEYDWYEKGLGFQIEEINRCIACLDDVEAIIGKGRRSADQYEMRFQLARCYAEHGELWQACREYQACINLKPDDITPHAERIQALVNCELWPAALAFLKRAMAIFGQLSKLTQSADDVQDGIDAIFKKMKNEWMNGNIHSTRKLLAEYLVLRPDDAQALELKAVIADLDREFAAEWVESQNNATVSMDIPSMQKKVVAHVKSKETEKGIGILEGAVDSCPDNRAAIREQIGDIRMMQKDFKSAVWNYTRALKLNPVKVEIQAKIDRAGQFLGGA